MLLSMIYTVTALLSAYAISLPVHIVFILYLQRGFNLLDKTDNNN